VLDTRIRKKGAFENGNALPEIGFDSGRSAAYQLLTETTMSNPPLPAETLDHIVDYLHDTKDALRNGSLVSKSWIPRTWKHLFADIALPTAKSLRSWKETFPDPSTSPARHAKTLIISCTVVDPEVDGWIATFSRIVYLEVGTNRPAFDFNELATPLIPFHNLSPTIKSLNVVLPALPTSQVFDLILSFPLLEDLAVSVDYNTSDDNGDGSDGLSTVIQPSSSPVLTGSLELLQWGGVEFFACRLMSLPGGLHFRRLALKCCSEEDILLATALVEECSHTLESLDVDWDPYGMSIPHLPPFSWLTFVPR
jgi:hypothetical protein